MTCLAHSVHSHCGFSIAGMSAQASCSPSDEERSVHVKFMLMEQSGLEGALERVGKEEGATDKVGFEEGSADGGMVPGGGVVKSMLMSPSQPIKDVSFACTCEETR